MTRFPIVLTALTLMTSVAAAENLPLKDGNWTNLLVSDLKDGKMIKTVTCTDEDRSLLLKSGKFTANIVSPDGTGTCTYGSFKKKRNGIWEGLYQCAYSHPLPDGKMSVPEKEPKEQFSFKIISDDHILLNNAPYGRCK